MSDCTTQCWAMPECATCGIRKKPHGRSAPLAAANGYCDQDCPGYYQDPKAGHFWPGEERERYEAARRREEGP